MGGSSVHDQHRTAVRHAVIALATAALLGALLMLSSVASAALPNWQNIDPAGVSNNPNSPANNFGYASVAVDPQVPTTVYLGTNYQGLYKSLDSGATWAKADTGPGKSLVDAGRTWTLAVDWAHPRTLYTTAGYGGGGVLKSTDGGISWADVFSASSASVQVHTNDISTIRVDPYNSNHLLASFHYFWHDNQDSGVVESLDAGQTWTVHNPAGAWGPGNYVWFGNDSATWLLASQNVGWWITHDSGATWRQFTTASASHGGSDGFYRDGVSTYVIITGTATLKSTDNGATWQDDSSGLPYAYYASLLSDGTNLYTAPGFPVLGDLGQAHGPWYTKPIASSGGWHAYNAQQPCDPLAGYCNGPASGAYDAINGIVYSANGNGGVWKMQVGASVASTPTITPSPTATTTAQVTATSTSTPALPTPTVTATPAATCAVEVLVNGAATTFTRPASFCIDQ